MIGIASFVGWLLISVYSSVPTFQMDFSDMVESKKSMRNWIGFAAYLNQDCFSSPFFANVISLPAFLNVFKREVSSGLYSVHMYYFGNWLCKMMTMGFYPCMLISIVFWYIDIDDKSNENFIEFMKIGFV